MAPNSERSQPSSLWLDENDFDLPTLEQVTVDRYLAHHDPNLSIGRFLNWAARHRITNRIDVPRSQPAASPPSMDEEALWEKVDALIQDKSTPMPSRIVGLFLLVFAQPIRDSVRLKREDVQLTVEHVKIQFGTTPIILPPPIADLLMEHLDETRDRRPYVGVSSGWLFEGVMPEQHLSEASVRFNLKKHGLHARLIKRARLDHLVQVLPASIVADITGITVSTAIRHLVCTPDGMPVVWGLASPKIGERQDAEAMLRHDKHLIRPGQVIIGDKGFAGSEFEAFISDELEAHLIRPDRKDKKPHFGKLGGIRQWVESVFDTLKGQLTLEDHGGRTPAGVYSRVAARLLALAAGIWHNWLIGATNKRSLIAYDH